MRPALITIAIAMLGALAGGTASASPAPSCVATITRYEATQLPAGSVGSEVSGLATAAPGLGSALVSPLAKRHLGTFALCREAEG